MAILLKVVGLVLAIGGLTAAGLGWPYRMIDWGNIQVVLGGLAFVGGLILAGLGVVLGAIRRLDDSLRSASRADVSSIEPALPGNDVIAPSMPIPRADEISSGFGGGAAVLAGAAAVTGAAAMATMGASQADDEKVADHPAAEPTERDGAEDAGDPFATPVILRDDAEHQMPDVSVEVTQADVGPERLVTEADQRLAPLADDGLVWIKPEEAPPGLSLDALTARINEAAGDLTALRRGVTEAGPDTLSAPAGPADEPEEAANPSSVADRSIDAADLTLAQDIAEGEGAIALPDDETPSAERDESPDDMVAPALTAALAAVEEAVEPEADPAGSDQGNGVAHATATVEIGGDEPEADVDVVAAPAEVADAEPDAPVHDVHADDTDDGDVEATEAEEAQADAPAAPAANAEGVVSVHRIGDATYTMFVDGTIRAETPDGAFGFATVAELKTYLAGDKSVARPLA